MPSSPRSLDSNGLRCTSSHTVSLGPRCHSMSLRRSALPLHLRPFHLGPQLHRPVGQLQIAQRPADVARGQREQRLGMFVDQRDVVVPADHHLRDRTRREGPLAQFVDAAGVGAALRRRLVAEDAADLRVGLGTLRNTRRLRSTGSNRLPCVSSISALPRNSTPFGLQREVQAAEDLRLGLGVEVHQGVAADQQVDPGDRRVLHQVVAAEDHRAAQVLPEHEAGCPGASK